MRTTRMQRLLVVGALAVAAAFAARSSRRHAVPGPARPQAPATSAGLAPANMAPQPAELTWEVSPRLPRDLFEAVRVPQPRRAARPQPDPTNPSPRGAAEAAPRPRVQILLLDPRRPLALVDNRRVAVGDSVSGYRVVAIEPDGVTFERRGERFTARP